LQSSSSKILAGADTFVRNFKRQFEKGDEQVANSLLAGLVGEPVTTWRKSYGRTSHFHFGDLKALPPATTKRIYDDEGAWILQLWSCRVQLLVEGESLPDDASRESLGALVGEVVSAARVVPDTWQLRISFEGGHELRLDCDPTYEEDEQWNLTRPDGDVVVFWDTHWGLRPVDE